MANIIHFADLPTGTISSKRCDYDQGSNKMGRIWSAEFGWVRATRRVEYKSNPSKHECDARCINASGRIMKCECSCNGKNHGIGAFKCTAG